MSGAGKYRAFISYSHKDEAVATWLHRALEGFAVPSRLVGKSTAIGIVPKRLRPIFRDKDELPTSAELGGHLRAALDASTCLIVICSPNSARSRWVNEEVLHFKRTGRGNRIFCLIAAGDPNASDDPAAADQECFAPALRHDVAADGTLGATRAEPIAADIRNPKDRPIAVLKLVAGLLGVDYDALRQRHKRRQRLVLIRAGAAAVMLFAAIGLGWLYLEQQRDAEAAERQRQEGLRIAGDVGRLIDLGERQRALKLALSGLPKTGDPPGRPPERALHMQLLRLSNDWGLIGRIRAPAGNTIRIVRLDPLGRRLLAVMGDNSIELFDVASGAKIKTLIAPDGDEWMQFEGLGFERAVRITGAGRYVTIDRIGSDGWRARLFRLDTGEEAPFSARSPLHHVAVHDRGLAVYVERDRTPENPGGLELFDFATGQARQLRKFAHPDAGLAAAAFSSDGGRVVVLLYNPSLLLVFDTASGAQLAAFDGEAAKLARLQLVPAGKDERLGSEWPDAVLVWGMDRIVRRFALDGLKPLGQAGPLDGEIHRVESGPGGGLLLVHAGGGLNKVDMASGEIRGGLTHDSRISPNGVLSRASDTELRLSGLLARIDYKLTAPDDISKLNRNYFSPDGALIIADGQTKSGEAMALIWDAETHGLVQRISGLAAFPDHGDMNGRHGPAANPNSDGTVLALRRSEAVVDLVRGPGTPKRFGTLRPGGSAVKRIGTDRLLFARSESFGQYVVVKLDPPALQQEEMVLLDGFSGGASDSVVIAPNGAYAVGWRRHADLTFPDRMSVFLFGPRFEDRAVKVPIGASVRDLAVSPDSSLVALVSGDGKLRLLAAESARIAQTIDVAPRAATGALAFSPDGARLAVFADSGGRLYGIKTATAATTLEAPGGAVILTRYNSAGDRVLAVLEGGAVVLFDAASGKIAARIKAHDKDITAAEFTPDGAVIVTASKDGTVALWDARTGASLATLRGHTGAVRSARFDETGRWLATTDEAGAVRVWDRKTGIGVLRINGDDASDAVPFTEAGLLAILPRLHGLRLVPFSPPPLAETLSWARRVEALLAE